MSREAHVRIWERVGVRFPCATRHIITASLHPLDAAGGQQARRAVRVFIIIWWRAWAGTEPPFPALTVLCTVLALLACDRLGRAPGRR